MGTKYSLFKEGFYDVMIRNGFIYKNKVFIRVIGDEIVQAFCLKPIEYFNICIVVFPLWAAQNIIDDHIRYEDLNRNPYWCERWNVFIPEWKNLESNMFYKNNTPESIVNVFKKISADIESELISILDGIVDFNSFVEWFVKKPTGDQIEVHGRNNILDSACLTYKSYLDGNFDFATDYIENEREKMKKRVSDSFVGCNSAHVDYEIEKALTVFDHNAHRIFSKFYRSMRENNTLWIVDHIKKQRNIELERFSLAFPAIFYRSV